ncbi:mediator of RNA polymerase II transcription subunit 7 [Leptopilina boulardi]|uniref:mediator of RNA polymerase II transcription subunit 7 n=1 Tax=Leptopilina boulardi TaxID=63433 RepID=UPI0021F5240B|nr:mediator of RNA polymerase II transcription subunit 7 [Leptopilina boulardi]
MSAPEAIQVSSLPMPPSQYVSLYTDENVRRGRTPRPPPPIHDTYMMFGSNFNMDDTIIRPLETQGIKRLYPQHFDRRRELRKLNHSLLVNFLDLIDLLVQCPDSPRRAEKVEDLSLLFIHIHHLLNEFRPHQARETLRVMMEVQKRQRIETKERFEKHLDKVQEILSHALQILPDMSELDSKLGINTDIMESMDTTGSDQEGFDSCNIKDRIMCNVIDELLLSNNLY